MALFAKFLDATRSTGLVNASLFAASRMLTALFGERVRIIKYYFMEQPISRSDPTNARSGSFSLAWVDDGWPLFSQVERPRSVISARYAQGARCLAAFSKESEFGGFLWFVVGPYEEDEVRARFHPEPHGEAAWDFDVLVMPRYRMSRLFSYLWNVAGAELASKGVRQTVSRISAFNPGSLAAHRSMGGRIVGEATFVCAGRWQLMKSSLRPKWHLSWRADQRPELHVGSLTDVRYCKS